MLQFNIHPRKYIINIAGKSKAGLAILTINSTKKNHETFGSKVGYILFFFVTEEGWVRRGKKRGRGLWENFPLQLFVRIAFPFPSLLPNPNQLFLKKKFCEHYQETGQVCK